MNAVLNIQIRAVAAQAINELKRVEGSLRSVRMAGAGAGTGQFGASPLAAFMPKPGLLTQASAGISQLGTKLEGLSAQWIKAGKNMQWTGRQLQFAFTLPVLLAGGAATKFYMDNARAFTQLQKVYQVFGESGRDLKTELEFLKGTVEALSNAFGVNQAEVTTSMKDFAEAGISGVALQKMTRNALEASVVGAIDLGEATQDLITIQAAYNMTSDETRTSLAQLNAIQVQSGISFSGLIDVVARAGSTAKVAGVDMEHLAAMASALVPATGTASAAGNSLKTIISRILVPTTQAASAMRDLGIDIKDTTWQAMSGADRVVTLSKAWEKATFQQKQNTAAMVFGRFQINRGITLITDLTSANGNYWRSLTTTADKTQTFKQYQEQLLTVLQSSPQRMKILWTVLQNALAKIIVPMIPALMSLVKMIVGAVEWFGRLSPAVQKFAMYMLLGLAVLGPFLKLFGAFQTLGGVVIKFFAMIASGIATVIGWLGTEMTAEEAHAAAVAAHAEAVALSWEESFAQIRIAEAELTMARMGSIEEIVAANAAAAAEVASTWGVATATMLEQSLFMGSGENIAAEQKAMAFEIAAAQVAAAESMAAAEAAAAWEAESLAVEASRLPVLGMFEEVAAVVAATEVEAATVAAAAWEAAAVAEVTAAVGTAAAFDAAMAEEAVAAVTAAATAEAAWVAAGLGQAAAATSAAAVAIASTGATVAAVAAGGVAIDGIAAATEVGIAAWPVLLGVAIAGLLAILIFKFRSQILDFFNWVKDIFNEIATLGKYEAPKKAPDRGQTKVVQDKAKAFVPPKGAKDAGAYNKYKKDLYGPPQSYEAWSKQQALKKTPQEQLKDKLSAMQLRQQELAKLPDPVPGSLGPEDKSKKKVLSAEGRANIDAYIKMMPILQNAIQGVTSSIDGQNTALDNWKTKLDESNTRLEIQAARLKLLELAPDIIPQVDSLIASLVPLHAKLDQVRADMQAQETVVKGLKTALDAANATLKTAQDQYTILKDKADALRTSLDKAKDVLSDLQKTPITGMKAMEDQIFANTMAQKQLRLEMMKMEDATGTIDEINKKLADLHGQIEKLKGERDALRTAGAGSDILGPMDQQIAALQGSVTALEGTGKPLQDMQTELDKLQRTGERLDLENSIQFDPLKRKIEEVTNTLKEMPFDELYGKIVDQQGIVTNLQTAWEGANGAAEAQQTVVQNLTTARDIIQASYDTENAKLQILQDNYNSLNTAINTIETSLTQVVTQAENAGDAMDQFSQDAQDDADDLAKKLRAMDEGAATDWADLLEGMGIDSENFDPFQGLKDKFTEKWDSIVKWWNEQDWVKLFDIAAIVAIIIGALTGNWAAVVIGIGILIKNHWRGIVQFLIDAVNKVITAINFVTGLIGIPAIPYIPDLPKDQGDPVGGVGASRGVNTSGQAKPALAAGGQVGAWGDLMARGAIPSVHVGNGFITDSARALVGEGSNVYPEYVIPTDPRYRMRAQGLYEDLGSHLAGGGILGGIGDLASRIPGAGIVGGALSSVGSIFGDGIGALQNVVDDLKGVTGEVTKSFGWIVSHARKGAVMAALAGPMKIFDAATDHMPGIIKSVGKWIKNSIYDFLKGEDAKGYKNAPAAYRGAIVHGSREGSVIRAGERFQSEAIVPLGKSDDFGKKELHFHGDLSFPNITSGNDAEAFVRNLEALSS